MTFPPAVMPFSRSHLSKHPPAVSIPVEGQVLVQDSQSVLFEDGCDVHRALHSRDRLAEHTVHENHPFLRGRA